MNIIVKIIYLLFYICLLTASVIPEFHKKAQDPLSDDAHFQQGEHNDKYDHDAFLGQDEASQFKQLSPEDSKERLGKLLTKIDKNSDGQITDEELRDHIRYMQKRYIRNDVDRTWTTHQLKDDKLGWKEYKESIYGPDDPEREIEEGYKKMLTRDQKRFKLADTNTDGNLDKEEYTCFMHPEDCKHMQDVVVEETINDIDKNADGKIDLEEYITDMWRPEGKDTEEPDWVKSERDMFAKFRDKNGDGKLDSTEMKEWILPSGFDHAEAESKHLISLADDNKDGKLSIEEVLAHWDVFVGSQATDYGEQLQKHDPTEL